MPFDVFFQSKEKKSQANDTKNLNWNKRKTAAKTTNSQAPKETIVETNRQDGLFLGEI